MHKFLVSLLTTRNLVPWLVDRRQEELTNQKNKTMKERIELSAGNIFIRRPASDTMGWEYGMSWRVVFVFPTHSSPSSVLLLLFLQVDFSCLFLVSFLLFSLFVKMRSPMGSCSQNVWMRCGVSFIKPSNVPQTQKVHPKDVQEPLYRL